MGLNLWDQIFGGSDTDLYSAPTLTPEQQQMLSGYFNYLTQTGPEQWDPYGGALPGSSGPSDLQNLSLAGLEELFSAGGAYQGMQEGYGTALDEASGAFGSYDDFFQEALAGMQGEISPYGGAQSYTGTKPYSTNEYVGGGFDGQSYLGRSYGGFTPYTGATPYQPTPYEATRYTPRGPAEDIEDFYRTNVSDPLVRQLQEEIMPSIGREYASSYWGSERRQAEEDAVENLTRQLTEGRSALFTDERRRLEDKDYEDYQRTTDRSFQAGQSQEDRLMQDFLRREDVRYEDFNRLQGFNYQDFVRQEGREFEDFQKLRDIGFTDYQGDADRVFQDFLTNKGIDYEDFTRRQDTAYQDFLRTEGVDFEEFQRVQDSMLGTYGMAGGLASSETGAESQALQGLLQSIGAGGSLSSFLGGTLQSGAVPQQLEEAGIQGAYEDYLLNQQAQNALIQQWLQNILGGVNTQAIENAWITEETSGLLGGLLG